MHYYKRHIGDYSAKAGHLTMLEHGAYCLLMDAYYNREAAPTQKEAMLLARARTPAEIAAVVSVLEQFFVENGGKMEQRRIEVDLAAYSAKRDFNRVVGSLGGQAKSKRNASGTLSGTLTETLSGTLSGRGPEPLTMNHDVRTTDALHQLSADANCPHAEILALYHEMLPANPRMKYWTGSRQANLRTRWREEPKRQNLDYWRKFFALVAESRFLTGRITGRDGRPFFASLEWLVLPSNFVKTIEGAYQ